MSYTHRKVTFQSTLPARGATRCTFPESRSPGISIHAPRTGSDPAASQSRQPPAISTHAPRTGSDAIEPTAFCTSDNFNPRSPHGERPTAASTASSALISTHAPRTGSDDGRRRTSAATKDFNPRSPHGERPNQDGHTPGKDRFQPTLPARGATTDGDAQAPPRKISTHAPRTGSDPAEGTNEAAEWHFNPRSPHGERLDAVTSITVGSWISTHAPRTGSDVMGNHNCLFIIDFNPRSPHGERHQLLQGTLAPTLDFNPRSPHGERPHQYAFAGDLQNFNPRSPHGERRTGIARKQAQKTFQPTLPARGATSFPTPGLSDVAISTHAPRTGSDIQPAPKVEG